MFHSQRCLCAILSREMPSTPHIEKHFTASEAVRDVVIGMSDGLTVPFALAAGLSGAAAANRIVITAGLAELAAGAIAMGLGGYLAARADREHYQTERAREFEETETKPVQEREEVAEVFRGYGLSEEAMQPILDHISANRTRWVDFMMRFELGLVEPDPRRARRSALTIAGAYIGGGLIPLLPYMLTGTVRTGLVISAAFTAAALFGFGFVKARVTAMPLWRGGLQTLAVGGLAATAAFIIARLIA
jgi:VIT1/CCC1 family predicted Fe2+/Mn2+ transporter